MRFLYHIRKILVEYFNLVPYSYSAYFESNGNITKKMSGLGWEVPRLIQTKSGKLYHRTEEGSIWRIYSYLPGKTISNVKDNKLYNVGELLCKYHNDLNRINFTPKPSIPYFHNINYYMNNLKSIPTKFLLCKSRGQLR